MPYAGCNGYTTLAVQGPQDDTLRKPYAGCNEGTTSAVQWQQDDTLRMPYAGCNGDTTLAVQWQSDTTFNRKSGAHLAVLRGVLYLFVHHPHFKEKQPVSFVHELLSLILTIIIKSNGYFVHKRYLYLLILPSKLTHNLGYYGNLHIYCSSKLF